LETQFWVEGGVNAGIVEKICLSSEERVFRNLVTLHEDEHETVSGMGFGQQPFDI
jgi:hypothetical protein